MSLLNQSIFEEVVCLMRFRVRHKYYSMMIVGVARRRVPILNVALIFNVSSMGG